jgi:hypothetical protein
LGSVRRGELLAGVRALPVELREVVACRYLLELSETEPGCRTGWNRRVRGTGGGDVRVADAWSR